MSALAALLVPGCRHSEPNSTSGKQRQLIVFNAGSLAAPISDLLNEFARLHPGITPQQESSGSLEAARKITELGKPCDVLAVADYEVIPSFLMPQHADWYAIFARNELVLIYTPTSKYIRPKSVELVALLQAGELDYIYCYRSIAEQHKLPFIKFPPEIDFSETDKAAFYATAQTEVDANRPGEKMKVKGMHPGDRKHGPLVRLTADVGVRLVALLTKQSLEALELDLHSEAHFAVKASAIHIF